MNNQWIRKILLIVHNKEEGIDLSDLRITFSVRNASEESPNTLEARVYNLSKETIANIIGAKDISKGGAVKDGIWNNNAPLQSSYGEFSNVTLNVGYENGSFGVIFTGQIKQYRVGRESPTTTYLDILAADGDFLYNSFTNKSYEKGTNMNDIVEDIVKNIQPDSPSPVYKIDTDPTHFTTPRGVVSFGMSRVQLRHMAFSLGATWSIQNGTVSIVSKNQVEDTNFVEINAQTGLIGIPEQTADGIRFKCLLNSELMIGGMIKINNQDVNQLFESGYSSYTGMYNQWAGSYENAFMNVDGKYMLFSVEHEGDTRGNPWYSNCIALSVSPANQVIAA